MSGAWTEIEAHVATGKTSWIYDLTKESLIQICDHYGIEVEPSANINELRKTLSEFVKVQAKTTKKEKQEKEKNPGTTPSISGTNDDTSTDVMVPNIGKLSEFEPEKQTWADYIEQVEFYLEANSITDDTKKRATLLTAIGTKNYAIIKSVCSPTAPKDITFQEILEKCKSHFGQSINELLARIHFHKRDQKENESLKDFVREIRKLAIDCKFSGSNGKLPMNMMLRDRFVAGIRNEELQRYLCRRHEESVTTTNPDGLSLDKALEIACSAESAEHQQKIFKQPDTEAIQNVSQNKTFKANNKKNENRTQPRDPCYRCGYTNHPQDKCFYKNEKCSFCDKVGHLIRVCKARQRSFEKQSTVPNKTTRAHQIKETSSDDTDDDDIYACNITVQTMQRKKKDNEYVVEIHVNSKPCQFEVDNGAHQSLMNKQTYQKIWPENEPNWLEKRVKLYGYGKKPIDVIGITNVSVRHRNKEQILPIVVTNETQGPNLLGRNWFEKLGIAMTGIHSVCEENNKDILKKFPSLTSKTLEGHKGTPIHIELKENAHAKFIKARRIPYGLQEAAMDALQSMVNQKMLTPVDQSDWATPVLFVKKPNGKIRVVGDYKATVNPEIRESEYPLPTVEEALATLNGGEIFSQVDLRDAYKQLRVDEETSRILTISTPGGLFNVNRLLDGIAAAPRIFQKFMATILSGIPGIQIYLDNVKIQGRDLEEHDKRLKEVLHRLEQSNLRVNVEKSIFRVKSMDFLGHQISTEGIQPLENKVTAIKNMKAPKDKRELQVFLGGINFYGRFIENRAKIAEPLHRRLDADSNWEWGEQEKKAFEKLKSQLIGAGILIHFDDKLPIVLSADASPIGIGAVLAHRLPDQTEKPIAYFSKTLNKTQRKYAQIDREALSLVQAVTHFHQYLSGRSFALITDHQPLLGIFEPRNQNTDQVSPKLKRYKITLSAYNCKLSYRPAKKHGNADFLSRLPLDEEVEEEEKIGDVLMLEGVTRKAVSAKEVADETDKDETLKLIKLWLNTAWPKKAEKEHHAFWSKRNEMSIESGCLLWGSRIIVPKKLRSDILKFLHANHPGIVATKAYARSYAWWPGIDRELEIMIKNCDQCQETRSNPPRAPIQKWESPGKPWIRLHIDFAGPFQGQTFFIVVDAYTKWTEVCRIPSTSSTNVIRELRRLFASFGLPETIVSDNDTSFKSEEMQKFCKINGIEFIFIAPYHPSSNGQAERAVQSTKRSLKILKEGDWETKISRFLLKQHTTPSTSTGSSPAEMMFNRKLRTPLDTLSPRHTQRLKISKETPAGARLLQLGDCVRMRTHRKDGPKWTRATVEKKTGPLSYEVRETLTDNIHKRHIDHLQFVPKLQAREEKSKQEKEPTLESNDMQKKHNYNLRRRNR